MTDEELLHLARDKSELTDAAEQALAAEMSVRGLTVPVEKRVVKAIPKTDPDSPYAKERELVHVWTVWSLRDALKSQALLDRAGIPFYMGEEMATGVDEVTSDFTKGVRVKIMRIGTPWARLAVADYEPQDAPPTPPEEDWQEIPVPCPKCRSTDVVLEPPDPDSEVDTGELRSEFEWTCESCGHHWNDDGVLGKKPAPAKSRMNGRDFELFVLASEADANRPVDQQRQWKDRRHEKQVRFAEEVGEDLLLS